MTQTAVTTQLLLTIPLQLLRTGTDFRETHFLHKNAVLFPKTDAISVS